mmetsp:Transcript_19046/g.45714  ORF Transcript_19046/g.45714 Transcript_19046/m.45714 type:complete len:187 (-) Transcript_19046:212-772(-)
MSGSNLEIGRAAGGKQHKLRQPGQQIRLPHAIAPMSTRAQGLLDLSISQGHLQLSKSEGTIPQRAHSLSALQNCTVPLMLSGECSPTIPTRGSRLEKLTVEPSLLSQQEPKASPSKVFKQQIDTTKGKTSMPSTAYKQTTPGCRYFDSPGFGPSYVMRAMNARLAQWDGVYRPANNSYSSSTASDT